MVRAILFAMATTATLTGAVLSASLPWGRLFAQQGCCSGPMYKPHAQIFISAIADPQALYFTASSCPFWNQSCVSCELSARMKGSGITHNGKCGCCDQYFIPIMDTLISKISEAPRLIFPHIARSQRMGCFHYITGGLHKPA
jgi:hypothetical protein